jgi:uncharacterized membrane protein
MRFQLISWKTLGDEHFGVRWQMDSINEQIFTLLPSKVVILDPVTKGRQVDFIS